MVLPVSPKVSEDGTFTDPRDLLDHPAAQVQADSPSSHTLPPGSPPHVYQGLLIWPPRIQSGSGVTETDI